MNARTLDSFSFRPIYHLAVRSKSNGLVAEASRVLTRNRIRYVGTNYDFTAGPEAQMQYPQAYLLRNIDDALAAKQALELLPDVERAPLSKFDGSNAARATFSEEELEKVGKYGFSLEHVREEHGCVIEI